MNRLMCHNITATARRILPGVLFLVCLSACKNNTQEINALMSKVNMQEDKAEDVIIIHSEGAKVKARLFAKEFVINQSAKPPFWDMRKGLKVEFYNDSTIVENTVTAKYARYYENQGNILLRDSIVIINRKGERLETEELVWNDKLKKFYTEKFVKITTPAQVMYGDGLEANQDFSWYQITNIKGVMQVNKSEVPGE
jgi:hypothetical protein